MNRILMTAVVATALAASLPSRAAEDASRSAAELMDIVMWGREPVGGPFALVDQHGRPRTDADFRGSLMLVYFGYTYCPDICPADLLSMGQAIDLLGPAGDAVQPLFVTVDPERDTSAHLAEYVPLFHPRLIGLTGSPEAIGRAAAAYKVYFRKDGQGDRGSYSVDHSAFIYLMDRDGGYLGFVPPGTPPDRLAAAIRPHLPMRGR
ncbi:MAG: SCO family protein [Rhizobiales bacterium]|nr:SCO family protein [Hyphomicrobiales bacterium]